MRYIYFTLIIFLGICGLEAKGSSSYSAKRPLIYIDPGHGGLDHGALIRRPRCEEKRLALTTAHYVKRYLERMGYRVSLTRSRDFFVTLSRRVDLANRAKAGIFLSIHFNSCPNKSAHGVEVYYSGGKNKRAETSKKLAAFVLNRVTSRTGAKKRGAKRGKFYVIRETRMPAVLLEGGFLTNPKERKNILKREYLHKIAKGVAEGVDRFVKSNSSR